MWLSKKYLALNLPGPDSLVVYGLLCLSPADTAVAARLRVSGSTLRLRRSYFCPWLKNINGPNEAV